MKKKIALCAVVCLMMSSLQMSSKDWLPAWVYFWRSKTVEPQKPRAWKKISAQKVESEKLNVAELVKQLTDIFNEKYDHIDKKKWGVLAEDIKANLLVGDALVLFYAFSVEVPEFIDAYNKLFSAQYCSFGLDELNENKKVLERFIKSSDKIFAQTDRKILRGIIVPIKKMAQIALKRAHEYSRLFVVNDTVRNKFVKELSYLCLQLNSNKIIKDDWANFFNNLSNFIRKQYGGYFSLMNRTMYTQADALNDVKIIQTISAGKEPSKQDELQKKRDELWEKFNIIRRAWTVQRVKGDIVAVLILVADLLIQHSKQQFEKIPVEIDIS